ncbi:MULTISPECIES: DOPA 4,5-dioxygenase family protein [unclassified Pseudophaeobacter]|uniref:DOPA 4,5-dioxygenase family protein n=1 Tax=unclassified Pseudophaeobacter TaxID=2637024 RepID=UPI0015734682|nr:DOPA 4,5-dioxygenase family protein [Pseudophaeobacter sp. EL27]
MKQITTIQSYHAHVYFDAESVAEARTLCETAAAEFGVPMGRVHEKPVGPHPMWSCQLAATPEQFAKLLPWLALNRGELIIFAHPETGNELEDHRDHGIWLGTGLDLDLTIFS